VSRRYLLLQAPRLRGGCSGDGRLSAISLRKGKLLAMSDQIEDELLSVEILKVSTLCVVTCGMLCQGELVVGAGWKESSGWHAGRRVEHLQLGRVG
jgi:hypothetical protein